MQLDSLLATRANRFFCVLLETVDGVLPQMFRAAGRRRFT
jgi:hypothetical protein